MNKYILSIDAGTTGITILIVDNQLNVINKFYEELKQYYPNPRWVEHDPKELIDKINNLCTQALKSIKNGEVVSIGITNQRETIVAWNKDTGKPIYNAIVWQCRRTKEYCEKIKNKENTQTIFNKTGLYIDCYFSASKMKWIKENVTEAKELLKKEKLLFGTIDTWIIWNLTNKNTFATDFTNASRTMLYNINDKKWDSQLLDFFNINKSTLPCVKNSIDDYGTALINNTSIPILGVAGDQQAALFGQGCTEKFSNKCTYGTGLFYLLNTGKKRIDSKNGLLTTLAINKDGSPTYAIEGSVFIGGAVIQWLRDELSLIKHADETEGLAQKAKNNDGVYIVPAFVGMGAPYWNSNCKGIITGLTRGSKKEHIVRASLESIVYQVNDLIECIEKDINTKLKYLNVDGGATNNNFLLQFQADISNIKVHKPENIESTAIGSALLAGINAGIWKNIDDILKIKKIERSFTPNIKPNLRQANINGWKDAIDKL